MRLSTQKILILGISGQDGSYLAENYLQYGCFEVHGSIRRGDNPNLDKAKKLAQFDNPYKTKLVLHYGDLTDATFITRLIKKIRPNIIYNLSAQSFVKASFDMPEYTYRINFDAVKCILENMVQLRK